MSNILKSPKTSQELLEMYYLELRCHLLEAAATFDRIQKAEGFEEVKDDRRYKSLKQALDIIAQDAPERAVNFLELFSEE